MMGIFNRTPNRKTLAVLAAVSLILLIGGGIGAWMLSRPEASQPLRLEGTPPPSLSDLATQYPKYADILLDPELDSTYKDFLLAYQEGGTEKAMLLAKERGILTENNDLRLVLELETEDTAALENELTEKGFRVAASSGKLVDVLVPRAVLEEALAADDPTALFKDMTSLEQVKRVRIPLPATTHEDAALRPSTNGEGARVIGAENWHAQGITGRGVKIGILDLGFRGYERYLGSSLPENVTGRSFVLDTELNETKTEHGAACAEIIHSIAPDAQLFLAAYYTEAEMGEAVEWLLAQGVQIISNSTGTAYGPLDGTAAQSRMVDDATMRGVLWVNSAGNFGASHYRAVFTDADGNGLHDFAPGEDLMTVRPAAGTAALVLDWDDWGGGTEDYSLFLYDSDMQEVAAARQVQDDPGDDAAEAIIYTFPGGKNYYIAIRAERITRSGVLDFFLPNALFQYPVPPYSVSTPGDARTSLTVGAVYWQDSSLETYSSQGPTHDGRNKPDISGPAGVPSVVYNKEFAGTSASTPHVAGAAALVLEANPGYTPEQLRDYLIDRSIDLGSTGLDPAFGSGTLWMGEPPGMAAVATPTLLANPAPTKTIAVVRGTAPGAKAGTTMLETAGLLCAFGLGLAGLFGFGLAAIMLIVSRPPPSPSRGSAAVYPARPVTPQPQRPPEPLQYGPYPEQAQRQTPRKLAPTLPGQPPGQPPSQPRPLPHSQPKQDPTARACPRCASPNRAGAKFCAMCGTALAPQASVCRRCGAPLRPESRFCPQCGQANP